MKKLSLILIFLVILMPFVSAYNVDITWNSNVNHVEYEAYHCDEYNCATLDNKVDEDYSGEGFIVNTNFDINTDETQYHALYFFREGYVPKGLILESWGNQDLEDVKSLNFNKKESCQANINWVTYGYGPDFSIGSVYFFAGEIQSAFSESEADSGTPIDIPQHAIDEGHYSSLTEAYLEIEKEGSVVYISEDKVVNIFKDEVGNVLFRYVPTEPGFYTARLKTDVIDNQCSSSIPQEYILNFNVVNDDPTAVITSDNNVDEGTSLVLSGSESSDEDDNIISYLWDLDNDGNFDDGNEVDVEKTFLNQGTYRVGLKVVDAFGGFDTAEKFINVNNVAPIVNAGDNVTINEGETVNFVGSFTDDGILDDHDVEWDFGDGSIGAGLNVQHKFEDYGIYTVTLTVDDYDGGIGTDNLIVTVNDLGPDVDFNFDEDKYEGETVYFYSDIDSYDDIESYSWDFGDGETSDLENPSHIYSNDGTYEVSLTVIDEDCAHVTITKEITILDTNPEAIINGDNELEFNEIGNFNAYGSSSYDGIIGYYWDWNYDGSFNGLDEGISTSHSFNDGTYRVAVKVLEADGDYSIAEMNVLVNEEYIPPQENDIPVINVGDQSVNENSLLSFNIDAVDEDVLSYSVTGLPSGASFDVNTGDFSWTPDYDVVVHPNLVEEFDITFTVDDNVNNPVSKMITIRVHDVNRAPTLNYIGNKQKIEGEVLQFTISANDPDGDNINYYLDPEYRPEGASFNQATRTFRWETSIGDAGIYDPVLFVVNDGRMGEDWESIRITIDEYIQPPEENEPPVFVEVIDQEILENQELVFNVIANDEDSLTYYADNLPIGASFIDNEFRWTPDYNVVDHNGILKWIQKLLGLGFSEDFEVTFIVSDGEYTVEMDVNIKVIDVNRAPVLSPISNIIVTEGDFIDVNVNVYDADDDSVDISFSNPLNNNGEWQTSIGDAGTYNIIVTAEDGYDGYDEESFTITVLEIPVELNHAPVLDPIGDITVDEGELINFLVTASDEDGDYLYYYINNKPKGSSFIGNEFRWETEDGDAGTYYVTFIVSDGSLEDSETIIITVNDAIQKPDVESHKLMITSLMLPDETIEAGKKLEVWTNTKNIGSSENEDVRVKITLPELGIVQESEYFNLIPKESKFRIDYVKIPMNTEPGEYIIKITSLNSKAKDVKYGLFVVI